MLRKQICEETRHQHPTRPASHLTTLHWPMAQASPGDTCPAQPEDAPTSSSLNDGQYLTRTGMDSASHSSPPKPNHSPTQESLEPPEEVILSTACTTSPSREHSCAHEAPDPSHEHSYKKKKTTHQEEKEQERDVTNHNLWKDKKEERRYKNEERDNIKKPTYDLQKLTNLFLPFLTLS